jgi:hypothetical protein
MTSIVDGRLITELLDQQDCFPPLSYIYAAESMKELDPFERDSNYMKVLEYNGIKNR